MVHLLAAVSVVDLALFYRSCTVCVGLTKNKLVSMWEWRKFIIFCDTVAHWSVFSVVFLQQRGSVVRRSWIYQALCLHMMFGNSLHIMVCFSLFFDSKKNSEYHQLRTTVIKSVTGGHISHHVCRLHLIHSLMLSWRCVRLRVPYYCSQVDVGGGGGWGQLCSWCGENRTTGSFFGDRSC